MIYLKLASATNPSNDYLELSDFSGLLCTSFTTLGMRRQLQYMTVKNRSLTTSNEPVFKRYNLTILILGLYKDFETKYASLCEFLERNKRKGLILYHRPYDDRPMRHCFCDIETVNKTNKMMPIGLTLVQKSLWLGTEKIADAVAQTEIDKEFAFVAEEIDGELYHCVSFEKDETVDTSFFAIPFSTVSPKMFSFSNLSYNEIPLLITITGMCVEPTINFFRKGEETPFRKVKINTTVADGARLEIDARLDTYGVWMIDTQKRDYISLVDHSVGSPFVFVGHGDYEAVLENASGTMTITYQEEYDE